MIETIALMGFLGLVGVVAYQVYYFAKPKNFDVKEKPNYWVYLLGLVGILFFWGLFFVSYMASFQDTTTITTTTDTTTIKSGLYFFLTYLAPIASALLWIGAILAILQTIGGFVQNAYNFAKGSKI